MKKIYYLILACMLGSFAASCSDTETYADLVSAEKKRIRRWVNENPYGFDFGNITTLDEEWLKDVTKAVLRDSVNPSQYVELGKWYTFSNGDFKRFYFRINSWGNAPWLQDQASHSFYENKIISDEYKKADGRSYGSSNVLVRYDSAMLINGFNYDNVSKNTFANNLDPNAYEIIYSWRSNYYSTNYYAMYYSTGSSYECTSGGLAFPCRFLWYGGSASLIVPFTLVSSTYASYYYTFYYHDVTYTKPTYLPQ